MLVKPRLLVVEDEPQLRRVYARILMHDFIVECEQDASSALLRIASGERFDVLLCDLNLGIGMSGHEFYDSLSLDLQRHTVMCSGGELDATDAFAAALGDRFFLKGGHIGGLITVLKRVASVASRAA